MVIMVGLDGILSPLVLTVLLCSVLFGFIVTLLTLHANDLRVFDLQGTYIPGPVSNLWGITPEAVISESRKQKEGLSTGEALLQELGDGNIVGINSFFGGHTVIVAHPDLAKAVLSGHHMKLTKTRELRRLKFLLGEGLLTAEGSKWHSHRQLIGPGFTSEALHCMIPNFNKQALRLVQYWTKNIRNLQNVQPQAHSIPVHLHNDVQQLTKTIMCYACFGYDFQSHENRDNVSAALDAISDELNARYSDTYDWLHWWAPARNGKTKSALACIHPLLDSIISTRLVEYTSKLSRKQARHSIKRALNSNYNSNDAHSTDTDDGHPVGVCKAASLDLGGAEEHRLSEPYRGPGSNGNNNLHTMSSSDSSRSDKNVYNHSTSTSHNTNNTTCITTSSTSSSASTAAGTTTTNSAALTRDKDLLDWLIQCGERGDSSDSKLSRTELRDHICTLISTGHETTSAVLLWTIYELCRHPHIQQLCHAEVDAVLGERNNVSYEDINKLNYVVQVLKESMRLHPASGNIARTCSTECTVGEYKLKAGTAVIIATAALHKHPEFWSEPEEFRPERFSKENIRNTVKHPYQYVPFGAGPRACIGQRFALMEVLVVLGTLLKHFSFALAAKDSKSVREEEGFTVHPKDLNVVVTLRK